MHVNQYLDAKVKLDGGEQNLIHFTAKKCTRNKKSNFDLLRSKFYLDLILYHYGFSVVSSEEKTIREKSKLLGGQTLSKINYF